MKIAMNYEKKRGRAAVDVSKRKVGYDIKSGGRLIEVKARADKLKVGNIHMHGSLLKKLGKNVSKYYIYVIYNINKEPKMKILPPDFIFSNIEIDAHYLIRGKAIKNFPDEE